jgi:hypothetical protein
MTTRRLLLATTAALTLLVATARPAGAFTSAYWLALIYEFVTAYVVPIFEAMEALPGTLDGDVLAGTQEPVGEAPGSYVKE